MVLVEYIVKFLGKFLLWVNYFGYLIVSKFYLYFVEIVYIILYVSGVWLRLWDGVILFYVNVDLMLRGFIDIFSEKFVVIII